MLSKKLLSIFNRSYRYREVELKASITYKTKKLLTSETDQHEASLRSSLKVDSNENTSNANPDCRHSCTVVTCTADN